MAPVGIGIVGAADNIKHHVPIELRQILPIRSQHFVDGRGLLIRAAPNAQFAHERKGCIAASPRRKALHIPRRDAQNRNGEVFWNAGLDAFDARIQRSQIRVDVGAGLAKFRKRAIIGAPICIGFQHGGRDL